MRSFVLLRGGQVLRGLHIQKLKYLPAVLTVVGLLFSTACGTPAQFGLNEQTESFGQVVTYNTQVDMLLVVDNSGSMGTKQTQLSQQLLPFIDYLVTSGFDFRIAVTTMDMSGSGARGSFVGSPNVLTKSTPDLRNAFIRNISQGTRGSDLSRGLEAMAFAISDSKLAGENSGFWRKEALLAVIFLTDEEDASANNTQYYIELLDQKKPLFIGGSRGWLASSIVVKELSQQCTSLNQFASPGYRYVGLSDASNGIIESICSPDLIQASANIKARITEVLTQYHLASDADVETIRIFINGKLIANDPSNGWTYDSRGYTITFHGSSIPPANAKVQISYKPKKARA